MQKAGYRNRRDDQNDRDHNQQFNERESCGLSHRISLSRMTIPDEHIRSRSKQTVALCMPDSADPHEPLSPWECSAISSPAPAPSPLSSFPRIGSDILCQLDFRAWEVATLKTSHK